jgi:aryl-alcohol dehydrogenase-like predicted oxidoreductase
MKLHKNADRLGTDVLAWVLRDTRVTSALFGASRVDQVDETLRVLVN